MVVDLNECETEGMNGWVEFLAGNGVGVVWLIRRLEISLFFSVLNE